MDRATSGNKEEEDGDLRNVQEFLEACAVGQVGLCSSYLDNGISVNAVNHRGQSGLMIAAGCGNLEIVRLLLKHGGDPAWPDNWGYNAILRAIAGNKRDIFQVFLEKCESLIFTTFLGRLTALTEAATFGRNEIIEFCVEYDEELLNIPVELTGMTPLMLAIVGRHHTTVQLLLNLKADTSRRNTFSHDAWGIAVQMMDKTTIDLLNEFSSSTKIPRIVVISPESTDRKCHDRKTLMKAKAVTPTSRVPLKREGSRNRIHLAQKINQRLVIFLDIGIKITQEIGNHNVLSPKEVSG